jgi:hypothetical protein
MAAGQGFKTFATGDVLTAADTNGYLMQGVWVFADAAARDAAVTSPQEGNMCYLKDTDAVQSYSGSAWTAVGGAGGGMTAISTGTLSSTGVTFSSIAGTYNNLELHITGYNLAGGGRLFVRVNGDSGTNYTGGYTRFRDGVASSSAGAASPGATAQIETDGGTTPDNGATNSVILTFPAYKTTTGTKLITALGYDLATYKIPSIQTFSYHGTAGAITSITIVASASTFSAGTYTLYGVK